MMIKITRAVQTSIACPSQWDLWDDQGNYYYARYRHGTGAMIQYKSEDWGNASDSRPYDPEDSTWNVYTCNSEYIRHVGGFRYGDDLDGDMDLVPFVQKMSENSDDLVELSNDLMHTSFGEHLRDQLVTEAGMTFLLEDGIGEAQD